MDLCYKLYFYCIISPNIENKQISNKTLPPIGGTPNMRLCGTQKITLYHTLSLWLVIPWVPQNYFHQGGVQTFPSSLFFHRCMCDISPERKVRSQNFNCSTRFWMFCKVFDIVTFVICSDGPSDGLTRNINC